MKLNKFALALAVSAAFSSGAMAASSTTLTVTGKITPVACTPTLGAGGNIDYNIISAGDLSATANTDLPVKTLSITVDCDGASAPFALQATDNKPGTELVAGAGNFGIGLEGANKIGYYTINFARTGTQGDGTAVVGLNSTDRTTWAEAPMPAGTGPALLNDGTLLGFADAATDTAVKPIETLTGTLEIRTVITRLDALSMAADVPFEGSATIDVIYL